MPSRSISESDWKVFRELQTIALDRFCLRVLSEIESVSATSGKTAHERYLDVYKLIQQRDEELALAFNDARRSVAWQQLAAIQRHNLLTDEEMSRFSPETREIVRTYLGI